MSTSHSSHSAGVELHGIAPVPAARRYGNPRRLLSVWFAPNMTLSSVFTGALGITLGLDFTTAAIAIVLGTVLGAVLPAYLGTFGSKTGSGQLPFSRLPFGRSVIVPAILSWGSAVCWDALVGLFGGQAVAALTGLPFWLSVIIVLLVQAAVGFLGYEFIHRFQLVMSVLLGLAFVVLTARILTTAALPIHGTAHGADKAGAFVLMLSIACSLSISWAPYASDFSRYLPVSASRTQMFWFTLVGLSVSFVWGQIIGAAGASVLSNETAAGVAKLMGGGALGVIGLLTIAFASISSNAMNDYSGGLSLQTIGIKVPRPVAALIVSAFALVLVLWMNTGNLSDKFENILLLVGYWIPCFGAIVVIDWVRRRKQADGTIDVASALAHRHSGWPALVALIVGIASTLLFMNTTILEGPVARALHGADLAYYVGFVVSGVVYLALLPLARNAVDSVGMHGSEAVPVEA